MKKKSTAVLRALSILFCTSFLFLSCQKSSSDPEPVVDERITLVKNWISKWAQQDLTKIEPKIEYFEQTRNTKEKVQGEKEFTLNLAKSLDALVLSFSKYPVKPATGELPDFAGYYVLKQYPDFTVDRLELTMIPSSDVKTKGTVVVKQILAGQGIGDIKNNPLGGQVDIWKVSFVVPR